MKRAKEKPEPKPITAQPPQDATEYDTIAPYFVDRDGNPVSGHRKLPGCYRTPKRRAAE